MGVRLPIPGRRSALTGVLLILLGAWGAVVPFVGPYFQYAYTPDSAWSYTTGRLWLSVVPGAAALIGGLVVVLASNRAVGVAGAFLAGISGAWFAIGRVSGPAWASLTPGAPVGDTGMRALEEIGFFTGLGLVIVFVAMVVLGRVVRGRGFRREGSRRPQAGDGRGGAGQL